jgi:hypothetical protein
VNLQGRLDKLERALRPPVADTGDTGDILLMLSDPEARHLSCEQIEALFNGGDFDEVTARFKARMAYLRERGAADGDGN